MVEIIHAQTGEQLDAVRNLMRAFVSWQYALNHEFHHIIDQYFDPDSFNAELDALPGKFAPPKGRLLLAVEGGKPAGCIAMHPLGDGVCEMKRLFVDPAFHGKGVGRLLTETLIKEAKALGYEVMRLDTGPKQVEALGLYRNLGFTLIEPYYNLDEEMKSWLVFMECRLQP